MDFRILRENLDNLITEIDWLISTYPFRDCSEKLQEAKNLLMSLEKIAEGEIQTRVISKRKTKIEYFEEREKILLRNEIEAELRNREIEAELRNREIGEALKEATTNIRCVPWGLGGIGDLWHLAYYIPKNHPSHDEVSRYWLNFKKDDAISVKTWVDIAVESLLKKCEEEDVSLNYIVRALGSEEADGNYLKGCPLDKLGRTLSSALSCEYYPELLRKHRMTPSLHLECRAREERGEILRKSIYINDKIQLQDGCVILVIDDTATTKATMTVITEKLKEKHPVSRFYYFTLALTQTPEWEPGIIEKNRKFLEFFKKRLSIRLS